MDAVAAAHAAGPAWAATAPRKRSEILRRCFELMLERKDMLAELIALENGKALARRRGRGGLCRRVLPLVLRGGGAAERRSLHRARGRQPHPRRAPADRRRRPGHALELPRRHGRPQDRARARRRLHLRAEARHRDAASPPTSSPGSSPRPASRRACSTSSPPRAPAPPSAPCCTTRACESSPSPARPRSAARCSRRPPTRSSTARWSSAATPPSSSSTTPTSRRRSTAR